MILHCETTLSSGEFAELAQQARLLASRLPELDDLPVGSPGRRDLGIEGLDEEDGAAYATIRSCEEIAAAGREMQRRADVVAARIRSAVEWEGESRG